MGNDRQAERPKVEPPKCRDIPWKCKRCDYLLGYGMNVKDETHLRIKVREEFVYVVEPKRVFRNCRRCGFINELHHETEGETQVSAGA